MPNRRCRIILKPVEIVPQIAALAFEGRQFRYLKAEMRRDTKHRSFFDLEGGAPAIWEIPWKGSPPLHARRCYESYRCEYDLIITRRRIGRPVDEQANPGGGPVRDSAGYRSGADLSKALISPSTRGSVSGGMQCDGDALVMRGRSSPLQDLIARDRKPGRGAVSHHAELGEQEHDGASEETGNESSTDFAIRIVLV